MAFGIGLEVATAIHAAQFGAPGDIPIKGDFDGDGKRCERLSSVNGVWYIYRSSDGRFDFSQFGLAKTFRLPEITTATTKPTSRFSVLQPASGISGEALTEHYDFRHFGLSGDIPANAR